MFRSWLICWRRQRRDAYSYHNADCDEGESFGIRVSCLLSITWRKGHHLASYMTCVTILQQTKTLDSIWFRELANIKSSCSRDFAVVTRQTVLQHFHRWLYASSVGALSWMWWVITFWSRTMLLFACEVFFCRLSKSYFFCLSPEDNLYCSIKWNKKSH